MSAQTKRFVIVALLALAVMWYLKPTPPPAVVDEPDSNLPVGAGTKVPNDSIVDHVTSGHPENLGGSGSLTVPTVSTTIVH